jgi:hypothetical protein
VSAHACLGFGQKIRGQPGTARRLGNVPPSPLPDLEQENRPVRRDQERLAEALAIERMHGDNAGDFVIARSDALESEGDMAGVQRWVEVADWLVRLRRREGLTS